MPTVSRLLALSTEIDTVGHRIIYNSNVDQWVVLSIRNAIYYAIIDGVNDIDAAVVSVIGDVIDIVSDANP